MLSSAVIILVFFIIHSFIHSFYIPWILVGKKPDRCGISLHIHIINGIKYICLESMCHIKRIISIYYYYYYYSE
jgi:hypothetical protein